MSSTAQTVPQTVLHTAKSPTVVHKVLTVPSKTFSTLTDSGATKPVRLVIPAIRVNASVESVEIGGNGNLGTPVYSPWDNVGWYALGTSPGERGSAVIDGHLDRPGGAPAVFWNLRNLRAGDEVLVINAEGKKLHFRVTEVAFYVPQEAPIVDIFGNTGGNYLNLITCAGDWIASEHQMTLRLVVYTVLV